MNGKLSTETVPGICFSKVLKLFWPASGATKVLGIFKKQAHDENITLKQFSTLLKNQFKVIILTNQNSKEQRD